MKRILHIALITLAVFILMPDSLISQTTSTSTTNMTAKEKEALQKAADEQKKAQDEMKKAQEEAGRMRIGFTTGSDGRITSTEIRNPSQQGGSVYSSRSTNSTSLDFIRTVTDNSATKEYTFDVEKAMKTVSLSISGSSKSGEIKISIIMPGNKEFSTVIIDEVGSMTWKKTFEITEEDARDKVGTWKFRVVTSKATGTFRLSLSGK